ncbi:hypothetical protein BGZ93_002862 [Podila epicladia]|nr:hypothetical protein BGZ93_002862 [Podila epicladia]
MGLTGVGRMLQFITMYTTGQTPKEIPFGIGCFVAAMSTGYSISVDQTRLMYAVASSQLLKQAEYGTPNSWIQDIEESKWRGRWVPFRDQLHSVKDGKGQPVRTKSPEDVSSEIRKCDLVLLYAHGGGFEFGDTLQCFVYQQKLMGYMQEKGVKIGIMGIDYSLSPETPFPGAVNEMVAAYEDLITKYGVDPKKIITFGESAGGNLAHVVSLKIRDLYPNQPELLPGGTISFSPYFPSDAPMTASIYDVISPLGCERFMESYLRNDRALLLDPYVNPTHAKTLKGLPPMLIIAGGAEQFLPSIEQFAKKVKVDGSKVDLRVWAGRTHCWFLVEAISWEVDRREVQDTVGGFLVDCFERSRA